MSTAPFECSPEESLRRQDIIRAELLDRKSGEWVPHQLVHIRAGWVEQTWWDLNAVYETGLGKVQSNGVERDIRPGVIAVTVTDEVIACNSLAILATGGHRVLISSMRHSQTGKPSLVAIPTGPHPNLRLVE